MSKISKKNLSLIILFLSLLIIYFGLYSSPTHYIKITGEKVIFSGEYFCVECGNSGIKTKSRLFKGETFTRCDKCKIKNHWILKRKL